MSKKIIKQVPTIPNEFKGSQLTKTEYVKNSPRKWTKEEIEWCLNLRKEGYSTKDIALSVGREEVSVSIKMKRLTKKTTPTTKSIS